MTAIIKREIKNYLKNPLLWIGLLVIIVGIYSDLKPYLSIHYFQPDQEIKVLSPGKRGDADILDGYIPSTSKQQIELGYEEIEKQFMEAFDTSKEEAQRVMDELREKDMTIQEIDSYLKENYGFNGAKYTFEDFEYHAGTPEEINAYIDERFSEHPYSYYFSRKFADFGGLYMAFFATILLAFLFMRDTKKDTYELLHTKPVSAAGYVCGKVAGGFLIVLFLVGILTVVFSALCFMNAGKEGFSVNVWDMPLAAAAYILPNMLMIICVYAVISLLFRNPLPTIPLLFLYIIYSNMGSWDAAGNFGYYGRALAIMVRFPGEFFSTSPPPLVLFNQIFLVIASALLIWAASVIWKRRRI